MKQALKDLWWLLTLRGYVEDIIAQRERRERKGKALLAMLALIVAPAHAAVITKGASPPQILTSTAPTISPVKRASFSTKGAKVLSKRALKPYTWQTNYFLLWDGCDGCQLVDGELRVDGQPVEFVVESREYGSLDWKAEGVVSHEPFKFPIVVNFPSRFYRVGTRYQ